MTKWAKVKKNLLFVPLIGIVFIFLTKEKEYEEFFSEDFKRGDDPFKIMCWIQGMTIALTLLFLNT